MFYSIDPARMTKVVRSDHKSKMVTVIGFFFCFFTVIGFIFLLSLLLTRNL